MSRFLFCVLLFVLLTACAKEAPEAAPAPAEASAGTVAGPFPKTIHGTIGHSYPLEDGSGRIYLGLLEYEDAAIIVSQETYDAKSMAKDDAEVSLSVEPIDSELCSAVSQCLKGS